MKIHTFYIGSTSSQISKKESKEHQHIGTKKNNRNLKVFSHAHFYIKKACEYIIVMCLQVNVPVRQTFYFTICCKIVAYIHKTERNQNILQHDTK
jgi:hypothetical protein